MSWKDVQIGWGRIFCVICTVAALIVFGIGAWIGGPVALFTLGLPAILVLIVFWTGPLARMAAGFVSKLTLETWEQVEKTDLRGIYQLMRNQEYAAATQAIEAILAKEPNHTEAMVCAVSLYRLENQTEKARQICLDLIRRDDMAIDTVQALMAQIGMTEQEINQASAGRRREVWGTSIRDDPSKAVKEPAAPVITACPSEDPEVRGLLAHNCIGSAVERVEAGLKKFPNDFEGWLLLAEIQILQCHSMNMAEQAVAHVRDSAAFTPEQKAEAEKRMREWKLRKIQPA
jgi:hypothetical protein